MYKRQIGLSVSLPIFNRNQGNIRAAKISVAQKAHKEEYARRQAENELFTSYARLEKAIQLYRSSNYGLEKDFALIIEGVNLNFQKRNISLLEFIDYYETYKTTCLRLYQTQKEVLLALEEEMCIRDRVSALRQLGFDYVFDTDVAADLTIMEEGTELLHRLGSYLNGDKEVKIPLMTSCCPGWVSFVEQHFPELRDNLSTAKSPQQMFGAIAKSYFAEKLGVDRKDLVVVSIMPCLAKKYEASRPEFSVEGNPDVDYSIYTRELARLIRYANIDFNELPDGEFDSPVGESTGASVIFGTCLLYTSRCV